MSLNLDAYLSTHIEVFAASGCWLGQPAPDDLEPKSFSAPDFLEICATVITAWNPDGQSISIEENRRLGVALEQEVAGTGLDFWRCIGKSPDGLHAEESLWVLTPNLKERKLAEQLARRFSQEGIFVITGAIRSLVIFSTDEHWTQSMIWARS